MAITKNAKKAHRASLTKRVYNIRTKSTLHSTVKAVRAKTGADAETLLPAAFKAIDKAAKRGVIKKNTADRKKARLVAQVKKTTAK